jgi:apolipoprotein N-acyltransferase
VSFALLCFAVPLHEGLRWLVAREDPSVPRPRPRAAFATVVVGLALYGAGWWRLAATEAEDREAAEHVRVGLVQANVGSTTKREVERNDRAAALRNRKAYETWTDDAVTRGAQLIVWPETAISEGIVVRLNGAALPPERVDEGIRADGYGFLVDRRAAPKKPDGSHGATTLLVGGYADDATGRLDQPRDWKRERRFNASMLRVAREDGTPASWSFFRKVKLMPFGEAVPGQDTWPSLAAMLPQMVPMTAGGADQPPLSWERPGARPLSIATFICYEAIVPTLVARLAGEARPDLLVNLTNDSWYGDTWEPHQHLAFSRFRAVEHRSPMLRATNTGISAVVSSTGEVLERIAYNTSGSLVRDVPLVRRPRTLYASTATTQPYAWWGIALVAFLWSRRRR